MKYFEMLNLHEPCTKSILSVGINDHCSTVSNCITLLEIAFFINNSAREREGSKNGRGIQDYRCVSLLGSGARHRVTGLSDEWQVSFEMPVRWRLFQLLKCIFATLIVMARMAPIGAVNIANGSGIIHCQLGWGEVRLFSSYNSGSFNDFSPPWQQRCADFRC